MNAKKHYPKIRRSPVLWHFLCNAPAMFLAAVFTLAFLSCAKEDSAPIIEQTDPIKSARSFFERETARLDIDANRLSVFRRSVEEVMWDSTHVDVNGDSLVLFVPVRTSEVFFVNNGNGVKGEAITLQLRGSRVGAGEWSFSLLSYLPDETSRGAEGFTGTVVSEGWFGGAARFAAVLDNNVLGKRDPQRLKIAKQMKMVTDCFPIYIITCGSADGGNTWSCREDYHSTTCVTYDDGAGSGGGGDFHFPGGGGSGGGNSGGMAFVAVAPAITINLQQRLNCFNTVPSNSATTYKITLHAHKGVGGGNKPGHAFITLEKSNGSNTQRLSYGFYPV